MRSSVVLLLAAVSSVSAHMCINTPKPLRHPDNPYTTIKDYDLISPLKADGSNFPCRGYQSDLGTTAGTPTGSFTPGAVSSLTLQGSVCHQGGSCQISLSFDQGKTFRVIKSYIGNCCRVTASGDQCDANQTYQFTIPSGTKAGTVLLSWSWFNEIGNREMYQSCAAITVTGSGTSTLTSYPNMFVAHVNNGCSIVEGRDVVFPHPGTDVTYGAATAKQGPPTGNCG
ncbi:lytic polysaccharide monooxygenase [Atractiella rhizophila]|nr:lytic polysaccharide monooxygenase [Atractiella rhizophila]